MHRTLRNMALLLSARRLDATQDAVAAAMKQMIVSCRLFD
jgi:hypothetical protein